MKSLYSYLSKLTLLFLMTLLLAPAQRLQAQACSTAQGNQTTYGTNNVWIGYVYTGENFNNYQGYIHEGTSSSPNFNEGFGGSGATFSTAGCSVQADNMSVRYLLNQTFASGTYVITVGGDDGYRFSTNGGSTWLINKWVDQSYNTTTDTVTLNGNYNFELDYYQDGGANQVTFTITQICMGTGNQTTYGSNNVWNGYIYQGENFQTYKGTMTEGSSSSPNFYENFGNTSNSNTATYYTNQCSVTTYQFSARYKLTQTLPAGNYTFAAGGDDGFRLSLDGGATWVINKWQDQGYTTATYSTTITAATSYNTVLEYYDNGGADIVSYSNTFTTLPVTVNTWSATLEPGDKALLKWTTSNAVNFDHFIIQRSTDNETFQDVATVDAVTADSGLTQKYSYTDQFTYNGDVYYRLAEVDRDGTTNYSTIVNLPMQASAAIRIYPTVVTNGQLTVQSPSSISQAQFQLFDMKGQKLLARNWSEFQGVQQVSIGSNLAPGAYIALLSDGQSILTKQIIIIR
jgi:PA14 domain